MSRLGVLLASLALTACAAPPAEAPGEVSPQDAREQPPPTKKAPKKQPPPVKRAPKQQPPPAKKAPKQQPAPKKAPKQQPAPKKAPKQPPPEPRPLDPEADYRRAVDLVNSRKVSNYPQAIRLLERIPREAKLYADAQAYLEWIRADVLVRDATKAFREGEVSLALSKLDEASAVEVLSSQALESVQVRRERWTAALRACQKGIRYVTDKQHLRGRIELRPVAEGKLEGAVRDAARAYLAHAEGKGPRVTGEARRIGRVILALDAKLIAPRKPRPRRRAAKSSPKDKDEGWGKDDWDDGPRKR